MTDTSHSHNSNSQRESVFTRFLRATEIDPRLVGMVGALLFASYSGVQLSSAPIALVQLRHSAHAGRMPVLSAAGHSTTSSTTQLHETLAVVQQ